MSYCCISTNITLLNWKVFDLRRPGGSPAQRIANLFVPTGEKSVVTTRRHFSKNEFVKWNVKRKMSSMFQNASIISHPISNIRQSLWTMKRPPQRDASAGLSEIHEMATNDKQKWKPATATGGLWWFCLLSRLISVAFVFWTKFRLQLWPSALSQWSNDVKCIQMSVSQAVHQQNLRQCTQVFQELLESSDCDMVSIRPRSPRKLLTSVLTSEIFDICWHAGTAKKNGSLSRTSLHNQASDVLLLPSWSRYVYNRSRIRRVMMSSMFHI